MNNILEISDIQKSYGVITALNGVSFSVPKNAVFGILGPNGSGKTTMLGILLDVLKADSGHFDWIGHQTPEEARKSIGALLETPNFYHYLNAVENLEIVAEIKGKGKENIDDALKKVKLFERRNSKFSTFSLGMKQRLAIASALISDPNILVLDEPTNGLDPEGIAEIREVILRLNKEGKTILMASHMLDEVEKVCTHVAILKKGNLLSFGHVNEVLRDEELVEVCAENMLDLENILKQNRNISIKSNNKIIMISLLNNMSIGELNKYCFDNNLILTHLQKRKRSLESKFIEITQ